ncbi:MAG: formyltransferase family protein [Phycisphaerae bacterium]
MGEAMLGPMRVRRVVLCTGGVEAGAGRYAAWRLAQDLPEVEVHAFFQSGSQGRSGRGPVPAWKRGYWACRAHLSHPRHAWKRWTLRRRIGDASRHLPKVRMGELGGVWVHHVDSVNQHVDEVRRIDPDVLLIYGGRLVAAEVLSAAKVALNIHCGKLPEYRGVRSAVFALAQGAPEQVGVTLHVATASLDAGAIVQWRAVDPAGSRNLGQLSARLTVSGFDLAVQTIRQLSAGSVRAADQIGPPRNYQGRDLTEEVARRARRNLRSLGASAAPVSSVTACVS